MGLPVGLGGLGVALLGEEEPSQEEQRFLILPPELFLAEYHSVCLFHLVVVGLLG